MFIGLLLCLLGLSQRSHTRQFGSCQGQTNDMLDFMILGWSPCGNSCCDRFVGKTFMRHSHSHETFAFA